MQSRLRVLERVQLTTAASQAIESPNFLLGVERPYPCWLENGALAAPDKLSLTLQPTHPNGVPLLWYPTADRDKKTLMTKEDVKEFNAILKINAFFKHSIL